MARRVGVIGVGQTKFGELWEKSLKDLIIESGLRAIGDADIEKNSVQSLFVGSMSPGTFVGQEHLGAYAADWLGMKVPSMRIEGACASGSLAFVAACNAIQAGKFDVALVVGAEKMTDLRGSDAIASLALAGDQEWEASIGLTFAGLYALMSRAHMHKYGTTREQMALVSVNNHKNGVGNKNAQFNFEISVDDVLKSSVIADPLTLLDCSPITDGSASVVIASEDFIKRAKIDHPIWLLGNGYGSDAVSLHDRSSITEMSAVKQAGRQAFGSSGITQKGVDFLEVHDCFSINEIIGIEDLGFCEKGMGGRFVENGSIKINSELPVNTTGGLKSIGHPVGATGVRQIGDIVQQIRGRAHIKIKKADVGMALNVGGSGATAVVNILGRDR